MEDYDKSVVSRYHEDASGAIYTEMYFLRSKFHRIGKPAYISYYRSGQIQCEQYWINGLLHNTDGPANISRYSNGNYSLIEYLQNGNLHRLDGPADTYYSDYGSITCEYYYLFGKKISKEDFYTPGFIDAFILEHS